MGASLTDTFLKSKKPIQRKKKISHHFSKSERKKPLARLSSKKQTVFKLSILSRSSGSSLNIQEIESPYAKDVFVPSVMAIISISSSMMNT